MHTTLMHEVYRRAFMEGRNPSGNSTHAKLGAKLKLGRGAKGARLGRGRRLEDEHRQERDRAAGGGRAFTDVRRCML